MGNMICIRKISALRPVEEGVGIMMTEITAASRYNSDN
jgi:hypothetical protein